MANVPVISVIMPVFNAERYLEEALDSILAQTFTDFELILIDDGSTDGSIDILNRYATVHDRIRLIRRPNTGLTKALNECLRLARGEFVARMDGDDIALPERFARQVKFLRAHPEVVVVGTGFEFIDEAGRLLTAHTPPLGNATLQEILLGGRSPICHPSAMMRRDAARRVGGYDESFLVAQDLDLWLRMGEIGQLANIPDVLLRYRQHEQSVSITKQDLQLKNMRIACERAWQRRGVRGEFKEFKTDAVWHPARDRAGRRHHRYLLRYGWWAFNSRQRRTAIFYGAKAITAHPLDREGWRLMTCALLKPLRPANPPEMPRRAQEHPS